MKSRGTKPTKTKSSARYYETKKSHTVTGRSVKISAVPPVFSLKEQTLSKPLTVQTVAAYRNKSFSGAAQKGTSEKTLRIPAFSCDGDSLKEAQNLLSFIGAFYNIMVIVSRNSVF